MVRNYFLKSERSDCKLERSNLLRTGNMKHNLGQTGAPWEEV